MSNKYKFLSIISGVVMLLQFATIVYGQNVKSSAEDLKLGKLKLAVEANPNSIKANENYIEAVTVTGSLIAKQYQIWMKRFPKSAILPFAIGKAYQTYNDTSCKKYLLKAIEIEAGLADAWESLSLYESSAGNTAAAINYMQKATELAPLNVDDAYHYAVLHRSGDHVTYDSLMLKVVYHFPTNEKASEALALLASDACNAVEKVAY